MTYEYLCKKCDVMHDVIKRMAESDREEKCPSCRRLMEKQWGTFHIVGAKVEQAQYQPAFGKVVKNKRELRYLAEKHDCIEIGNEKVDTMEKRGKSLQEETRRRRWEDA